MSDTKLFIQYKDPLEEEYQGLYNIIDGVDSYDFMRLSNYSIIPDDFIRSIKNVDNTGDNIADKSYHYADLTAIYWYWKNISCDIIGNDKCDTYFLDKVGKNLISPKDIEDYFTMFDFIIRIAVLDGSTCYEVFDSFHGHEYMDIAGEVIEDLTPDYYNSFIEVMNGEESSIDNIMICKKSDFDAYCSWIFEIIEECERRMDIPDDDYQHKMLSFIAERLLLVWIKKNNKTYEGYSYLAADLDQANEILVNVKNQEKRLTDVETFASENDEAIVDLANVVAENDEAIIDLAEYIQSLEERIEALEKKEE